jgi:hypothetical protein
MENKKLFKKHAIPVYKWPKIAPELPVNNYCIVKKDGSRALTKQAKEEIKKRLESEGF